MSLEKPRKLMEVLVRRTRAGQIDWQESFPDMFQVSFKDNSVQLRAVADDQREAMVYTVSLLNSEGEVAEDLRTRTWTMTSLEGRVSIGIEISRIFTIWPEGGLVVQTECLMRF